MRYGLLIDAIRDGRPVEFDMSGVNNIEESARARVIEDMFVAVSLLLSSKVDMLAPYIDAQDAATLASYNPDEDEWHIGPQVESVRFVVVELLKNALVHGNKADLKAPLFLRFDYKDRSISVYDVLVRGERPSWTGSLSGAHSGVRDIKASGLSWNREPLNNGQRAVVSWSNRPLMPAIAVTPAVTLTALPGEAPGQAPASAITSGQPGATAGKPTTQLQAAPVESLEQAVNSNPALQRAIIVMAPLSSDESLELGKPGEWFLNRPVGKRTERPVINLPGFRDKDRLTWDEAKEFIERDRKELQQIADIMTKEQGRAVVPQEVLDIIVGRMGDILKEGLSPDSQQSIKHAREDLIARLKYVRLIDGPSLWNRIRMWAFYSDHLSKIINSGSLKTTLWEKIKVKKEAMIYPCP